MTQYKLKIKGQGNIIVSEEVWKNLREKNQSTNQWFIPRRDEVVSVGNGIEFNLKNYDGALPIYTPEKKQIRHVENAAKMTQKERDKASGIIREAKLRWILRTGRGYQGLSVEDKQELEQLRNRIGEEIFARGPEWDEDQAAKAEFRQVYWDRLFDTDECYEKTFQRWNEARLHFLGKEWEYEPDQFMVYDRRGEE